MRLTFLILLMSSTVLAGGGSVEGTLSVKRDGKPAFVKNSLVYIRGYETDPSDVPEKLAQTGRAFDKVVLPIVRKGRVQFTNEEPIESLYHHVFTPGPRIKFESPKYRPNDKPYVTKPGVLNTEGPVTMFCDIHKEMISTIYVVPNAQFTLLTTAEGDSAPFKIEGIRPGKWQIVAWHRSAKDPVVVDVEIKEGQSTKVALTIDGASGIEQLLIDHQRREKGRGYQQKPDGGWMGEAVGLDETWK